MSAQPALLSSFFDALSNLSNAEVTAWHKIPFPKTLGGMPFKNKKELDAALSLWAPEEVHTDLLLGPVTRQQEEDQYNEVQRAIYNGEDYN